MTDNEVLRDTMNRLISAVTVDEFDKDGVSEYDVLSRLAVKAGLMWRCINPQCEGLNHLNCTRCDNCNSRRPKAHSKPEPEDMRGISLDYQRRIIRKNNPSVSGLNQEEKDTYAE